jgi:hypothetical protein
VEGDISGGGGGLDVDGEDTCVGGGGLKGGGGLNMDAGSKHVEGNKEDGWMVHSAHVEEKHVEEEDHVVE